MGNDRSRQDHIQTQFKSRRVTPASTDNDTFNRVKSRMMPNLHYSAVATALAIASIGLINTPADAYQKHIHQKYRHRMVIITAIKSKKNSAEAIRKDITRHTNIQPKTISIPQSDTKTLSAKPPTYYPYSCMENSPKRNHSSKPIPIPIPIQTPTR